MKRSQTIRTLNDFRDAAFGFRLPRILLTALDLDFFTVMGVRWWTVSRLAQKLQASVRGVDILCRNLASAGLLTKRNSHFRSTALGQKMLNAKSRDYRGAYLELIGSQWEDWSKLTQVVRSGKPLEDTHPDDPEYRRWFTWAMHYRSIETAKQVASQVNLKRAKSLLDLGGGPGTYAIEFLKKNPQLQATVLDRPSALEVAKEIAASHKSIHRLSYLAGDFLRDRISGCFDVIWISNIIHIYSAAENRALFRKLAKALSPGGRLIVQDTFLVDRRGLSPSQANLFAVTMLLFTQTGNTYHYKEVLQWLTSSGLLSPRMIHLKRGTGDWDGILLEAMRSRKPGRPLISSYNSLPFRHI